MLTEFKDKGALKVVFSLSFQSKLGLQNNVKNILAPKKIVDVADRKQEVTVLRRCLSFSRVGGAHEK